MQRVSTAYAIISTYEYHQTIRILDIDFLRDLLLYDIWTSDKLNSFTLTDKRYHTIENISPIMTFSTVTLWQAVLVINLPKEFSMNEPTTVFITCHVMSWYKSEFTGFTHTLQLLKYLCILAFLVLPYSHIFVCLHLYSLHRWYLLASGELYDHVGVAVLAPLNTTAGPGQNGRHSKHSYTRLSHVMPLANLDKPQYLKAQICAMDYSKLHIRKVNWI